MPIVGSRYNGCGCVVYSAQVKGWTMTPTHFIEQGLTDVWLDR